MTRRARTKADPIERRLEHALEPGDFIPWRDCDSFVSDLEEVAASVAELTASDPSRAVSLYETFLAACHAKVEELDDSSGCFGMFVGDLYCAWIKARRAAKADPAETAALLFSWMDDDEHAFLHRLESDLAKALDRATFAALEALIRSNSGTVATVARMPGGAAGRVPDLVRGRWVDSLRALYAARRNLTAYMSLAEETGVSATDCHVIASLLAGRRKLAEALVWVERGLGLDSRRPDDRGSLRDLGELKRVLLTRLGRGKEALAAAWADYRESPNECTYEDLMKVVPRAERRRWREKAMDAAEAADIPSPTSSPGSSREAIRIWLPGCG